MAIFTGPQFINQSGPSTGTPLDSQDLNVYAIAQTFWMNPNTPSIATMTLTFSAPPLVVVNSGTAAAYVTAPSSGVTITPGGAGSQDYYVFLLNNATFSVLHVNAGTAFGVGSYPANGCLLCKATSNAGNTALTAVSTALAPISPFPPGGMLIDGSNSASAVAFSAGATLSLSGLLTASNGAAISAGLTVAGGGTIGGGLTVSSGTSALQALTAATATFSGLVTANSGLNVPTGLTKLIAAIPGSANNGLVNVGAAPFDGITAGFFNGSGAGTGIATNAPSGFGGNLWDAQVAGITKGSLSALGDLNITRDIIGGRDITSVRDINAGRDMIVGRNFVVARYGSVSTSHPTVVMGSAVGATGTASMDANSTDSKGTVLITLTSGGGTSGFLGQICRVTFTTAWTHTPAVIAAASTAPGYTGTGTSLYATNISTTGFDVYGEGAGAQAYAGTVFHISYLCIGD